MPRIFDNMEDNGNVVGLADEYLIANPQKQNRDGYQLARFSNLSLDLPNLSKDPFRTAQRWNRNSIVLQRH